MAVYSHWNRNDVMACDIVSVTCCFRTMVSRFVRHAEALMLKRRDRAASSSAARRSFLTSSGTLLLWVLLMMPAGCSDGRPVLVNVSGKVVFQGQPLTAGSVSMIPAGDNDFQGDAPSSQLQLDGQFEMKTFPWGAGVTPGRYTVILSSELANRIRRPDYGLAEKSPLKVIVPNEGISNMEIVIP